jgi:hypothetical protein
LLSVPTRNYAGANGGKEYRWRNTHYT